MECLTEVQGAYMYSNRTSILGNTSQKKHVFGTQRVVIHFLYQAFIIVFK